MTGSVTDTESMKFMTFSLASTDIQTSVYQYQSFGITITVFNISYVLSHSPSVAGVKYYIWICLLLWFLFFSLSAGVEANFYSVCFFIFCF